MTASWRTNPAVKWGVIFGVALGIVGAVNTLLLFKGVGGIGGLPQFIVVLVVFFAAGLLTTRETGDVTKGAIAGLTAGALGTALGGLMDIVLAIVAPHAYAYIANLDRLADRPDRLVLTALFALVISLIEYGIFGGGVGALGGLAGRRLAQAASGPREQ